MFERPTSLIGLRVWIVITRTAYLENKVDAPGRSKSIVNLQNDSGRLLDMEDTQKDGCDGETR